MWARYEPQTSYMEEQGFTIAVQWHSMLGLILESS